MKIESRNGLYHIYTNPEELLKLANILTLGYDELANGFEYVIHNTQKESSSCKAEFTQNSEPSQSTTTRCQSTDSAQQNG